MNYDLQELNLDAHIHINISDVFGNLIKGITYFCHDKNYRDVILNDLYTYNCMSTVCCCSFLSSEESRS